MKKYLRLSCTVCNRTIDKLVDNTRATPDRCTITLGCQGRLLPVEYRSDGQITPAPQAGVVDWSPRQTSVNTPVPTAQEAAPKLIDTGTGSLQQLVLGVRLNFNPPAGSTASLSLQERVEVPKSFKSFVFRRENEFSTISGVEDGISQKTLKFRVWGPEPDEVEVYLNGVKLQQGTGPNDYQVDDGSPTPPAPSNTIKFNTPILPVGTFQVEVIVSKATPVTLRTLTFNRNSDNDSRLSLGAWENVSHVERYDDIHGVHNFYLFTFDVKDNAVLARDTILFTFDTVFVNAPPVSLPVAPSDCIFMLSREPHTKVDRYPDISVYLSELDATRDYLKYSVVDGVLSLSVTDTSIHTNFPPSVLHKFNPEPTVKVAVAGETEQIVVDGKLIVGPDT